MMASPFAKKQRLVARYARSIRDRTGSQFRSYFWGEEIEFIHRPNAFFLCASGKKGDDEIFQPQIRLQHFCSLCIIMCRTGKKFSFYDKFPLCWPLLYHPTKISEKCNFLPSSRKKMGSRPKIKSFMQYQKIFSVKSKLAWILCFAASKMIVWEK